MQQQYKADFDKVTVLDVELNEGDIIYIPAYWWHSFKYEKLSSICAFKYRTFMNVLAISPELILSLLQNQNIKREVANKMERKVDYKKPKLDEENKNNSDNK